VAPAAIVDTPMSPQANAKADKPTAIDIIEARAYKVGDHPGTFPLLAAPISSKTATARKLLPSPTTPRRPASLLD
jgi:hypothetical protein